MATTDKVKVAVRVRPFNRRELDLGTNCVVDMEENQTILFHPTVGFKQRPDGEQIPQGGAKKQPKTFAFDHCFWSMDENNKKFANQEKVFNALGKDILERAFEGYNACIFAYGQTGSGKSYSMMGTDDQKGVIPRLCDALFLHIADKENPETVFKVEVSYMEIYNERVRDLLDPKGKHNLKVREHNILGPYVDGLSTLAVSSFNDIDNLMSEGSKSRTVAATNMNSESSRSHAVFNIILTATLTDIASGASGEKVSKMSLVDLAGSERAQKTGAMGDRLREGSNINKSLTTLGLVISALADSGKSKNKFVPYRDSVLTWLLKDNLGGNSKTVMVATVSPAADNYEETLSTLRYADRAKRIVNHAVVNEDPNARIIRELREEVDTLRGQLSEAQSNKAESLREKLNESEKLIKDMTRTWEQKLQDTERIHAERQQALTNMGISVQTSGIKVGQGKYYLVNLNADPSLNELLVYYLKEQRTLVGRPGAATEQDIQLNGLGIKEQHALVDIEQNDVYVTPLPDARTCVNGKTISERTKCKHGDRLLLGNYHFFRINCPKTNSPSTETPQNIDYEFAQQELMMQEMSNDPIQTAIEEIERSHEKDKEEALQKQREKYERQMALLRTQLMSPGTPSAPYPPFMPDPFRSPAGLSGSSSNLHQQWAEERERTFKQSLAKLKEEVVRANAMVREANFLAEEMGKQTEFSVTLQIPAANLTPNRKRGAFVSEPAILVKRKNYPSQVWAMEKFENKVIDMRDMYEDWKERGGDDVMDAGPPVKGDPFYESQQNHNLIGVANVFLEALFYDVKLDYHVPIISQQGEVAGRLHVELGKVSGVFPQDRLGDADSESSGEGSNRNSMIEMDDEISVPMGNSIVSRVHLKSAKGLPHALSNFVFCQYVFWGYPEPIVVPPVVNPESVPKHPDTTGSTFIFDDKKEFTVRLTEEFVEHCTDGALSIEVWGHRSTGFGSGPSWEIHEQVEAKSRSIMDRWTELTRKIELWTEIHELNDQGEYVPVENASKPEVLTGGVFQLRQGHSRRIVVNVKPVQNSGTLPIIVESIQHVSIGCVCARSRLQKGLDSYQEVDLGVLRERWTEALEKRREYLDSQLQKIMSKEGKTDADVEREKSLIDQWVCLTEERNAVLVPAAGSGIPGAPADWEPPAGMEEHVPVLFLDLNADSMTTPTVKEGLQAAGINSILPKEHGAKFFVLPPVKNSEKDVSCIVSWDSSIHDSVHLNRVTPANERVYLILKVVVRLSHPASMELVLRKRVCINVYKRQSITEKLKKKMTKAMVYSMGGDYLQDTQVASGVMYEIVSNIPKASEDLEDRESLAQIAASQHETTADGETYIEKYIKGVSAVESILTLDKLRQEVAVKELMSSRGRALQMRKATSVPNFQSVLSPVDKLAGGSINDLYGNDYNPERHGNMPKQYSLDALRQRSLGADFTKELANKNFNLASPITGISPQPTKLVKPMKTLVEEQQSKPLLNMGDDDFYEDFKPLENITESDEDEFAKFKEEQEEIKRKELNQSKDTSKLQTNQSDSILQNNQSDSVESDEFTDFQEYKADESQDQDKCQGQDGVKVMKQSSTGDSLADVPASKGFASSVTSSGYGSQAVSMQTLSSEDSASIRSLDDPESVKVAADSDKSQTVVASSEDDASESARHVTPDESNSAESNTNSAESVVELGVESRTAEESSHDDNTQGVELENVSKPESDRETNEISDREGQKTLDEGLLDTGCPSNLGTPLAPLSPAKQRGEDKSGEPSDRHSTDQSVILSQGDAQASVENQGPSVGATDDNIDVYSANVLDELENLDSELNDTFASPAPPKSKTASKLVSESLSDNRGSIGGEHGHNDSNNGEAPGKTDIDTELNTDADHAGENVSDNGANLQVESESQKESAPKEEPVHLRSSKGDRSSTKRKSWSETSEIVSNTIPENSSLENLPAEVRLRTGGTIDVSKGVKHLKKGRGEGKGKSAASPLKATFRPVSMPVDMLLAQEEAHSSSGHDTDNDEDAVSVCSFGSRADLNRLGEVPIPSWIQIGIPVQVLFSSGGSKTGTVQFTGTTEFAGGNWIGVELDAADGKNDGSVKGVRYFKCRSRHGIFVRHDKVIMDKKRKGSKGRNSTTRKSTGNLNVANSNRDSLSSSPRNDGSVPSYMRSTVSSSTK